MLQKILISNYALIEELELEINRGLTTITGETGAGKSILLGAIGLILGNRADISVISEGKSKCVIEGYFDIESLDLKPIFDREELDFHPICIIRREVTNNGKSRSFINDTPVNLNVLKEIGQNLVEIQTQHTNLLMGHTDAQRALIDTFLKDQPVFNQFKNNFKQLTEYKIKLKELEIEFQKAIKEKDYLAFQRDEIKEFDPKEGEEISLENDIQVLSQAQGIKDDFTKASVGLSEGDFNARQVLQGVLSQIKGYETVNEKFAEFNQRVKSLIFEIEDLGEECIRIAEKFEPNEEKLGILNDRFNRLQLLFRKHQINKALDLIELENSLSRNLISTEHLENQIEQLKKEIESLFKICGEQAREIHELRKSAASEIEKESIGILKRLNMPHSQVKFNIEFKLEELGKLGADQIELYFTSNLGIPMQKASQIASGGELSRLNFAFRSIVSKKKLLPTLIYDEADTGISGEVAAKMGELFRELGSNHQVICITHLPQIAAAGNHQWEIRKFENAHNTQSKVEILSEVERVNSLAKMLSGSEITETAKINASELIQYYKGFNFS